MNTPLDDTKKVKLICTIGPATSTPSMVEKLIENGMDIVRINTAFGTLEDHARLVETVRSVSDCPILFDLKGSEARVYTKKPRTIHAGETFILSFEKHAETYINQDIRASVEEGETLFLNAGLLECTIERELPEGLLMKAKNTAFLKDGSSVHSPLHEFELPPLSPHDIEVIHYANKIDEKVFALSYTRTAQNVLHLLEKSPDAIVIAKIESRSGVANIHEIARVADGVMIARGDLGLEIEKEKIPRIQKEIIDICRTYAKASIVATEMLESMVNAPLPTRAEVSDVANAVMDGADCLMLSAETAMGKYPIEAVKVMRTIARENERYVKRISFPSACHDEKEGICQGIGYAITDIIEHVRVDKVLTPTSGGFTARMISRHRLPLPIIATTRKKRTKKLLSFYYGVKTIETDEGWVENAEKFIDYLARKNILQKNEMVLVVLRTFNLSSTPDTIHLIDLKNATITSERPTGEQRLKEKHGNKKRG